MKLPRQGGVMPMGQVVFARSGLDWSARFGRSGRSDGACQHFDALAEHLCSRRQAASIMADGDCLTAVNIARPAHCLQGESSNACRTR